MDQWGQKSMDSYGVRGGCRWIQKEAKWERENYTRKCVKDTMTYLQNRGGKYKDLTESYIYIHCIFATINCTALKDAVSVKGAVLNTLNTCRYMNNILTYIIFCTQNELNESEMVFAKAKNICRFWNSVHTAL